MFAKQCKMTVEEIMNYSDVKLILLGDGKYAKIRNIHTPHLPGTWPCPSHTSRSTVPQQPAPVVNKRKHSKVTCRVGTKPGSSVTTRQAVKTNCEAPTHHYNTRPTNRTKREQTSTKPLRDNRTVIDYSVLNCGYDTEVGDSPKWRQRHLSRPSRKPTVPQQAAQKKIEEVKLHAAIHNENLDLGSIMDSPYPTLQLTPLNGVTPTGVTVCNET